MSFTKISSGLLVLMAILASVPGSAQVKQPIQAPAGLDEGTETKLTPDLTSELRDWANSSQSKLQDLLQTSDHMTSMTDVKRYLRKGIETVVLGSAPRQTELLMRYVLNRAIKASDIIEKDSDVSAIGVVDQQVRILRNSVQFAVQYAKDDLAAIENATSNARGETIANLPYARFGVKYSAFLMNLDLSITDASAQYDIALFALGLLQWDLYRDEKHNLYATAITKLNDAIAILGDTAGKNDGETVQKLSQARLAYQQAMESLRAVPELTAPVWEFDCRRGVRIGAGAYLLRIYQYGAGVPSQDVQVLSGRRIDIAKRIASWSQYNPQKARDSFSWRQSFAETDGATCLFVKLNGTLLKLSDAHVGSRVKEAALEFDPFISMALEKINGDADSSLEYGTSGEGFEAPPQPADSQPSNPQPRPTSPRPAQPESQPDLDPAANPLLQMNASQLSTSIGVGADYVTDNMPGKDIAHAVVQVNFGGIRGRETGDAKENTYERWFMITFRAGYTVQDSEGSFDVIDAEIVPYHAGRYWTDGTAPDSDNFQDYSLGHSWVPVSYQRDIKLDLDHSATLKLVAFDGAIHSNNSVGFNFIFDMVGMRLYQLAHDPKQRLEGYLAGASGEMNNYWKLGGNNYIDWTLIGARADLGLGTPNASLGLGLITGGLYSKVAVVLGKCTEVFARWDLKYLGRQGLSVAHSSPDGNVFQPWYDYNRLQLGIRRKF